MADVYEKLQNTMNEVSDYHGFPRTSNIAELLRYLYKANLLRQDEIDRISAIIGTGWMAKGVQTQ